MLDPVRQAELNRCMTEAMLGYTRASMAAYAAMLDQSMNFFSGRTTTPERAWPMPATPAETAAAFFNPFAMWGDMVSSWTSPRPAVAPPMAFMMIAWGFPRDVAWPAAEANAAMLDVAETVSETVQQTFSSYRSDGGHAAAHVIGPRKLALTLMYGPIGAALLAPWPSTPWSLS